LPEVLSSRAALPKATPAQLKELKDYFDAKRAAEAAFAEVKESHQEKLRRERIETYTQSLKSLFPDSAMPEVVL
jgi:hypothetical protein